MNKWRFWCAKPKVVLSILKIDEVIDMSYARGLMSAAKKVVVSKVPNRWGADRGI